MPSDERQGGVTVARVAGIVAIVGAVALVAVLLFFDTGGGYTIHARFTNAGQLVKGNLVEVGGIKAGKVTGFRVTDERIVQEYRQKGRLLCGLKGGVQAGRV